MPPCEQLAYAHAVQLLVDVFLLLTPFALYSEVGFWSIAATGVLTTFYQASGTNAYMLTCLHYRREWYGMYWQLHITYGVPTLRRRAAIGVAIRCCTLESILFFTDRVPRRRRRAYGRG